MAAVPLKKKSNLLMNYVCKSGVQPLALMLTAVTNYNEYYIGVYSFAVAISPAVADNGDGDAVKIDNGDFN